MTTTYQGYQAERGQPTQALLEAALFMYPRKHGAAATVVLAHPSEADGLVPPQGVTVHPTERVRPRTLQLGHEDPAR